MTYNVRQNSNIGQSAPEMGYTTHYPNGRTVGYWFKSNMLENSGEDSRSRSKSAPLPKKAMGDQKPAALTPLKNVDLNNCPKSNCEKVADVFRGCFGKLKQS